MHQKKLGDASYNFAKEVDWNNGIFLQAPGKFQPLKALKAIDKMIEMGAAADPKLLKEAAEAHHKAIGSISGPNGVTSRADWDAVNAALGRVVASVPKAKVMAVYDAVKDITDPKVPAYMKSLVNGPDAEKARVPAVQGCRCEEPGDRCQCSCRGAFRGQDWCRGEAVV